MAGIDSYTKLMLHFDTDSPWTDSSDSNHTVTQTGGVILDGSVYKWTASVKFDGDNDTLLISDTLSDFYFGASEDFTIDFWVRFSVVNSYQAAMSSCTGPGAQDGFWLEFGSARGFTLYDRGSLRLEDNVVSLTGLSINTWYHFAILRNGTGSNNLQIYKDGVLSGQDSYNGDIGSSTHSMYIGKYYASQPTSNGEWLNGNLDELRVSKGIARWTSNFTPETEPYSAPAPPAPATKISGGGNLVLTGNLVLS